MCLKMEYRLLGISYLPRKMEPTLSSETSAYNNIQASGKFPEVYTLYSHHGESLKTAVLKNGKFIYNMISISGRSRWVVLEKSVLANKFIENTSACPY
jgi:hypothetical protein